MNLKDIGLETTEDIHKSGPYVPHVNSSYSMFMMKIMNDGSTQTHKNDCILLQWTIKERNRHCLRTP